MGDQALRHIDCPWGNLSTLSSLWDSPPPPASLPHFEPSGRLDVWHFFSAPYSNSSQSRDEQALMPTVVGLVYSLPHGIRQVDLKIYTEEQRTRVMRGVLKKNEVGNMPHHISGHLIVSQHLREMVPVQDQKK